MAWKTPAGQKKPTPTTRNNNGGNNSSFPGLKPAAKGDEPKSGGQTKYEELQLNEVMVLQAIVSSPLNSPPPPHFH